MDQRKLERHDWKLRNQLPPGAIIRDDKEFKLEVKK